MKFLSFLLLLLCFSVNAQNPIVKTTNGKIQGLIDANKTIQIFKGIPFAAPPVGELRWKAPQATQKWSGVRQCTAFSASPFQNSPTPFHCWSEEFIASPEPLNEDCLYLNVWASTKNKTTKLPVFVWIYGGGLSSGSANCAIYDGEEMAKKGIVFVSINYRVGAFGFMAHPELSKESGNTSGNYGFLDQMAALRWVQQNIVAFGGDPNNVTIAGQSAGAFSVNALIASPLAKGLFHKAIPQSGGILSRLLVQNLEEAEKQGLQLMQKAKATNVADLRKMSSQEIQKLSNESRFGITLDGYVLPTDLLEHFRKGLQNAVPLITGWVTGDGDMSFGPSSSSVEVYKKEAETKYGEDAAEFLGIFPANTEQEVTNVRKKLTLLGFAGLPTHLLAGFNTSKTYMYQFSHIPPAKPNFPDFGAFHTSEVPYALHTLHTWARPWKNLDKEIENMMSSYWVNFAKTGNPNGKNLPEWKTYDKQTGNVLVIGDKTNISPALLKKEFDFLEKH